MYIERDIRAQFKKIEKVYSVISLVGARQAGKTTFLKEQMKGLSSSYLLFDDPDIRALCEEDIKKFERQYVGNYDLIVLDEVQYCKDAGKNLKYLAEKNKKIWLTASSEIILNKEVLSYLVGRVSIVRLYPFSLDEFLKAKSQKEFTQQILKRIIWEHLTYGGYPKVVTIDDIETKKIILKDLYDTMILKDIALNFSIEDIRSLEEFVRYLSFNIGNLISYETVSNEIGLSFQTLKKYFDAMEKSYLVVRISPFYRNKTKEITKQPKVYFLDTGLRNIISKTFASDPDGKLFENYVLSELIKIGFFPKYWRTKSKAEVDFIVEKDSEIIPLEIKFNASEKIEKSLHSFIELYKPKRAFIVTYTGNNTLTRICDCTVTFTDVLHLIESLRL